MDIREHKILSAIIIVVGIMLSVGLFFYFEKETLGLRDPLSKKEILRINRAADAVNTPGKVLSKEEAQAINQAEEDRSASKPLSDEEIRAINNL